FATDLSENQIKHAVKKENIIYKVERAEKTDFIKNQFDLITVAQAIHWFSFDDFYKEVYRTLRPNGIFAVIGYALLKINPFIDNIINKFYTGVIRNYWDKERRYIDENYLTIPFPFEKLKAPVICSQHEWTFEQLTGYLNTWSAIQHFIKENRSNPVDTIINHLKESWASDERKQVCFPILLRVGRK
ncbi:MAG: class I SAM-dependent methyltransferase, partial [Parafilimonas sp.]